MTLAEKIMGEVAKVFVGKNDIIRKVMLALLAQGHVLLEDRPGVGKTTLALAMSKAIRAEYRRIQFTPDVMPSDITGFSMYDKEQGVWNYQRGAIVCNLFLADEINRASSRTQAALLEAMEEGRVTMDGIAHKIPNPLWSLQPRIRRALPERNFCLNRRWTGLWCGYPLDTLPRPMRWICYSEGGAGIPWTPWRRWQVGRMCRQCGWMWKGSMYTRRSMSISSGSYPPQGTMALYGREPVQGPPWHCRGWRRPPRF